MPDEHIVKYFYQNEKDTSINHLIIPKNNAHLSSIRDLVTLMTHRELLSEYSYIRFKDVFDSVPIWFDIKNEAAPLPLNSKGEIEVKILTFPDPINQYRVSNRINNDPLSTSPETLVQSKKVKPEEVISNKVKKDSEDLFDIDSNKKSKTISYKNKEVASDFLSDFGGKKEVKVHHQDTDFLGDIRPSSHNKKTRLDSDSKYVKKSSSLAHDLDDLIGFEKSNEKKHTRVSRSENTDLDSDLLGISMNITEKRNNSTHNLSQDLKKEQQPAKNTENDFLDLDFDVPTAKVGSIEHQSQKMTAAQTIEPKIQAWAYNKDLRKDIRTLLTTAQQVLGGYQKWKPVELSEIIDEDSLKKKVMRAILTFHPDKNIGTTPEMLYILERVTSEINSSYKDYKRTHGSI